MDARVRETLGLLVSDGQWAGELEGLLQKLSLHFVSKDDLQVSLRDLELRILKEVTHHVSVTKQTPTSETIMSAVNEAGISGITEAVCRQACTVAGRGHGVLLAGPPMPASRPKRRHRAQQGAPCRRASALRSLATSWESLIVHLAFRPKDPPARWPHTFRNYTELSQ